jgi:hypothetical protein
LIKATIMLGGVSTTHWMDILEQKVIPVEIEEEHEQMESELDERLL